MMIHFYGKNSHSKKHDLVILNEKNLHLKPLVDVLPGLAVHILTGLCGFTEEMS